MVYDVKLPIGLNADNVLVHIKDVPSGLACNCVCPECNARLIAVNKIDNKQIAHFRHHESIECKGAVETALHRYAKQIIAEAKVFHAPKYVKDVPTRKDRSGETYSSPSIEIPDKLYHFDQVIVENHTYDDFIPDVTGINNTDLLHIEIRVTHPVDLEKAKRVRNIDEAMIEIDLSDLSASVFEDKESLIHRIVSETDNKHWISHPDGYRKYLAEVALLDSKVVAVNKIIDAKQASLEQARTVELDAKKKRGQLFQAKVERLSRVLRDDINVLHETMKPSWQSQRLKVLEQNKSDIELPLYLNYPVKQDWYINVHRSLWQPWLFKRYIHRKPHGQRLDLKTIGDDIINTFGVIESLSVLSQKLADIKCKSENNNSMDELLFTIEEKNNIPNMQDLLDDYFRVLHYSDVIKKNGHHDYVICRSSYSEINREVERILEFTESGFKSQTLSLLKGYRELYYSIHTPELSLRLDAIMRSLRRVLYYTRGECQLCLNCFMFSKRSEGPSCPFCSSNHVNNDCTVSYSKLYEFERQGPLHHLVEQSCNNIKRITGLDILKDWGDTDSPKD